ncbi:clavaminate synthase-like protein [Coleophoma crateriformis]|uniref:Clavaminate synthase-like protein n=1 Tax=Coleophoma crateriformis TaxID=565419 RepID=A0A3D8T7W2_9HELO|nr:clavaminate synthase-like protein [Coleophoma crateriformis]
MAPQTSAVNSDNLFIPLVDFSLFLNGTPTERIQTAQSILHGFQTAGFIYLKNIPIASDTVQETFQTSARFFTRPQAEKDALAWTTPAANRGYVAHGREKTSTLTNKEDVEKLKAQAPDLKESFEIGREGEEGHPNNWPSSDGEATVFKESMCSFFAQCKSLHMEVMRAIAVGMGLDEYFFDQYTDVGDNTLRLLHYPSVDKSVFAANKLQVRAGEHTDYGSITLLFQDDRGGLQVKSPNGTFVDATPMPGTVVVNAGDLLARWSNDTIKSTLHRVVEPKGGKEVDGKYPARYSMAYFCNPNFKSFIEAIPGTYGAGAKDPEKKYEGINSHDYLEMRLAATY